MNHPLKVTICTTDGHNAINGINAWLANFLPVLRSPDIEIRLIVYAWSQPEFCTSLPRFLSHGFICDVVDFNLRTDVAVKRTLELLRSNPPDAFVPNMVIPALFAARWVREAGIPTIGMLHNDDQYNGALVQEFCVRRPNWRLSHLVYNSSGLAPLARIGNPFPDATSLITYDIPLPKVVAAPPIDVLRLIYVGRFAQEQKRILDMGHALIAATRAVGGIEADIYGSGPESAKLADLLRTEGANCPVRLHDRIENVDVPGVLAKAHVCILLSDYEGLPVTILEAMACGLVPVCLDNRSGIPELVIHGQTGLLVQDRDESFINAIRQLKESPALWLRLSAAARAKVAADYNSTLCVNRWRQLIQRLVSTLSPRPIEIPATLILPPPNPGFGWDDRRTHPLWRRVFRKTRRVFRLLRQRK